MSWTSDAWAGRTAGGRTLRAALVPAALAYGAGTAVRNRLYDAGVFAAQHVPARVISVGNLTVGGTGKTPTTLWLAEQLRARGARVGIVARGYRKDRAIATAQHPRAPDQPGRPNSRSVNLGPS